MAQEKLTLFQRLTKRFGFQTEPAKEAPSYQFSKENILKTDSREDFEKSKLEAQQSQYISDKWSKLDQSLYNQSVFYEPNRLSAYYDFESMEFSLAGETKIATLNGFVTIKELSEMGRQHEFIVYSYDHNIKKVVPAVARNAHYTRDEMTYKITFDDGSFIIATHNHKFLKRDGTFVEVQNLSIDDSMMPFYRKSFSYKTKENWIYTCNSKVGYHDWVLEDDLMAQLGYFKNSYENNLPHTVLNLNLIAEAAKTCKTFRETSKKLGVSLIKLKNELKLNGFKTWASFLEFYKITKHKSQYTDLENVNFNVIPWDLLIEVASKNRTMYSTAEAFGVKTCKIRSSLRAGGFKNWKNFMTAYGLQNNKSDLKKNIDYISNHKIKSIEPYGVVPVYDLTVPGYKNFATDTIFSHNTPEISAALDIYSEESCTMSEKGQMLSIYSESQRIKEILEELFYNVLDVNTNLPMWTRGLCKYGDNFIYLKISPKDGVIGCQQLPNIEIERIEGSTSSAPVIFSNDVKKQTRELRFAWKNKDMEFQSWEIAHFRLLGDDRKLPYGTSILDKVRRVWKQLLLAEDAMLIYRITRAPERRVFKVFVGNMDDNDIESYVQKIANKFKRDPIVDQKTGQVDMRFNQMSVEQDYFIPVRDLAQTMPIETLPGATNLSEIADIEYIQKKLLAALRAPKAFLGFEEVLGDGKNLALLDIRFARTINRVQKAIIQELNKIALIHLYINGFEDELHNFSLSLTNPSSQSDLLKTEQWKEKIQLYKDATSDQSQMGILPVSHTWAKKNILGMSDNDVILDLEQQRLERAIGFELTNTQNVIKRSGVFDNIDSKYGISEKERGALNAVEKESEQTSATLPPLEEPPQEMNSLSESEKESVGLSDLFNFEKAQKNIIEIEKKIKEILN